MSQFAAVVNLSGLGLVALSLGMALYGAMFNQPRKLALAILLDVAILWWLVRVVG